MPSKSKSQRRLMGMALAYKRGKLNNKYASDEVKRISDEMSEKDLEDFAKTDEDDLPEKISKNENYVSISESELKEIKKIIFKNYKRNNDESK